MISQVGAAKLIGSALVASGISGALEADGADVTGGAAFFAAFFCLLASLAAFASRPWTFCTPSKRGTRLRYGPQSADASA
ncbi:MAG: hypothetical protein ACREUU_06070 [Gammaproteobacteria bacterium]